MVEFIRWVRPLEVVEKLDRVNYKVKDQHKKEKGIVHINNLKKWVERETV